MAPSSAGMDSSTPYHGHDKVAFGNGNVLPISRVGTYSIAPNLKLRDILIVPNLKKKLLSVSKLTNDYPVDFLFSRTKFAIQDTISKRILATGTHKDGLYVFNSAFQALVASVISSNKASFELWHKRLGHVNYDVISLLNKNDFCVLILFYQFLLCVLLVRCPNNIVYHLN